MKKHSLNKELILNNFLLYNSINIIICINNKFYSIKFKLILYCFNYFFTLKLYYYFFNINNKEKFII